MTKTGKNVNIRDVAREAGVSPISVSRALSTTPTKRISDETKQRILEVCARLHYEPNEHFRRVARHRSDTMAFLFPHLTKPVSGSGGFEFYADFNMSACILGAQEYLAKYNIGLLLLEATDQLIKSGRYLKMIRGKLLDGIFLWGMCEEYAYARDIIAEGIPAVQIQNEVDSMKCSKVICDDYAGMRALVEHAVSLGHRRFGVLQIPTGFSVGAYRIKGIYDTLEKHGIAPVYEMQFCGFTQAAGLKAAQEILAMGKKHPTCVIAASGSLAYGCIAGLRQHGFKVPEDISVISANALQLPGTIENVSTYYSNFFRVGALGAEILLDAVNGNTILRRELLPVSPIEGETLAENKG